MKTIGFIVNPIAGMGGAVGLKGTDGQAILNKAILLGAEPLAPKRAESFLSGLESIRDKIQLITGAGKMGEDAARKYRFAFTTVGKRREVTTAEDTKEVAEKMRDKGVDLIVFCGGDGTARDVLDAVGMSLPVLGVPTGVKMHSAIFAVGQQAAAKVAIKFLEEGLPLKEVEVMDIDEEAYRKGHLSALLYGYLSTPYEPTLIQGAKTASIKTETETYNQTAIATHIIEEMEPDVVYIISAGTTTRTIADLLGEEKTLLGVDLFCNKKMVAMDVNEKQILKEIEEKRVKIIVTPIGGQGFIFGRGNQQISPKVIRQVGRDNIIVIATKNKLRELKSLKVDTGDQEIDGMFNGYIRVVAGYHEEHVVRAEGPISGDT